MRFKFKPLKEEHFNGEPKGYVIHAWKDNDRRNEQEYWINYAEIFNNTQIVQLNSKTFSNFELGTVYYAQIQAVNAKRDLFVTGMFRGPLGNIVKFKTFDGIPEMVEDFRGVSMGSSAFYLSWTKPKKTRGQLIWFYIYYNKLGDGKVSVQRYSPNVTHVMLNGLTQNTVYHVRITAGTTAGEGDT